MTDVLGVSYSRASSGAGPRCHTLVVFHPHDSYRASRLQPGSRRHCLFDCPCLPRPALAGGCAGHPRCHGPRLARDRLVQAWHPSQPDPASHLDPLAAALGGLVQLGPAVAAATALGLGLAGVCRRRIAASGDGPAQSLGHPLPASVSPARDAQLVARRPDGGADGAVQLGRGRLVAAVGRPGQLELAAPAPVLAAAGLGPVAAAAARLVRACALTPGPAAACPRLPGLRTRTSARGRRPCRRRR